MSNNENNQQQPGMASFPYGVASNQMMQQQFFPSVQPNQVAGMHFNGVPSAPQLMPNLPMFFNPFQTMGGLPQQLFHPMQMAGAPMGGQMPQPASMVPPTADQNPQFVPMGGAMPMFPPMGGYSMPMMGPMGMMGGHPFMQPYMFMPMQMPVIFPPNVPLPEPILIKAEVKEEVVEAPSVEDITPVEIRRRNFTIAHLLKKTEVKEEPRDEPVDQEAAPNAADDSNVANPAETSDSPVIPDELVHPSPIVPTTPSLVPDEIPDSPASPDRPSGDDAVYQEVPDTPASPDHPSGDDAVYQEQQIAPWQTEVVDQVDAPVVHPEGASPQETFIGDDEYLSGEETADNPEGLSQAHSNTHSFGQKTPDTSRTPDRLMIDESDESASPAGVSVPPLEESGQMERPIEGDSGGKKEVDEKKVDEDIDGQPLDGNSRDSNEARIDAMVKESEQMQKQMPPETSESRESLLVHRIFRDRSETPPPSVPPRFPRRRRNSSEDEGRVSTSKEEISPWRQSPVRRRGGDERDISPRRGNGRANPYNVLLKGISSRLMRDPTRIERFVEERYGRCRFIRVHGEAGTAKLEFVSKMDRDTMLRYNTLTISREILTIHEDRSERMNERRESTSEKSVVELRSEKGSESKEEAAPSRMALPPTPIPVRMRSTEEIEAMKREDANLQLEKCTIRCQGGNYRKDIILTAGPIPKECSATSVVNYFRGLHCHVLGVPFPSHRPHEYIILRFDGIGPAKRILAAQEHRVMGHVIPVYPPFDVHLQLNGMRGLEDAVMETLQDTCGVLVSEPSLPYLKYPITTVRNTHCFGYVTFGRPQDGLAAIKEKVFFAHGRKFSVVASDQNFSFKQFADIWETKCKFDELTKKIAEKKNAMAVEEAKKSNARKKSTLKKTIIAEERPILTVGPIPEHCQKECDDYLLSNFDEVHAIPFAMTDGRHFRLLSLRDPVKISELLREGYLNVRVGEKEERVLISPSFDVAFKRSSKIHIDSTQLVTSMQRKYGPIVRHPVQKHGFIKVAFGRIQDGLRAIEDSPHFKTLNVMAEACEPNQSFTPFVLAIDLQVLLDRVRQADRMEAAANIQVSCRANSDDSIGSTSSGKRRFTEAPAVVVDDDVLICSPPAPKKAKKPEVAQPVVPKPVVPKLVVPKLVVPKSEEKPEMGVAVRVSDTEQWIPDKAALVAHFGQFGKLAKFEYKDHLEAFILFEEPGQADKALQLPAVRIGGRWLNVVPLSQSTPSTSL